MDSSVGWHLRLIEHVLPKWRLMRHVMRCDVELRAKKAADRAAVDQDGSEYVDHGSHCPSHHPGSGSGLERPSALKHAACAR